MYIHVIKTKGNKMAKTIFHAADKRGHANHGWLNAKHSFSFANYHDPSKIHFGALRVLNDDIVAPAMGFGKHPHDNMEIITVVLDGVLEHADSMGHTQTIAPNEVQVMSAGTGVYHSEYNHSKEKPVNLLQSWIFPATKGVNPSYDQAVFAPEDRVNKFQTLVSPVGSDDAGLKINQAAWMYRTTLEAGNEVSLSAHSKGHGFYVFVIEGNVTTTGHDLGKRDALGISEAETLTITGNTTSDVLVYEVPMYN